MAVSFERVKTGPWVHFIPDVFVVIAEGFCGIRLRHIVRCTNAVCFYGRLLIHDNEVWKNVI